MGRVSRDGACQPGWGVPAGMGRANRDAACQRDAAAPDGFTNLEIIPSRCHRLTSSSCALSLTAPLIGPLPWAAALGRCLGPLPWAAALAAALLPAGTDRF